MLIIYVVMAAIVLLSALPGYAQDGRAGGLAQV